MHWSANRHNREQLPSALCGKALVDGVMPCAGKLQGWGGCTLGRAAKVQGFSRLNVVQVACAKDWRAWLLCPCQLRSRQALECVGAAATSSNPRQGVEHKYALSSCPVLSLSGFRQVFCWCDRRGVSAAVVGALWRQWLLASRNDRQCEGDHHVLLLNGDPP